MKGLGHSKCGAQVQHHLQQIQETTSTKPVEGIWDVPTRWDEYTMMFCLLQLCSAIHFAVYNCALCSELPESSRVESWRLEPETWRWQNFPSLKFSTCLPFLKNHVMTLISNSKLLSSHYHCVSHDTVAVPKNFSIRTPFSNAFKPYWLSPSSSVKACCLVAHKNPFECCKKNVVYCIPFECGFWHVGQSGQCLSLRLLEHSSSTLKSFVSSELVADTRECNACQPVFSETSTLHMGRNKWKQLLLDSVQIATRGNCVSNPSLMPPAPVQRLSEA